jgi:hypothetical protein
MEFSKSIDLLDMHVLKLPLYYNSKEGKTIKVQEGEGRSLCMCEGKIHYKQKCLSCIKLTIMVVTCHCPFGFQTTIHTCDAEY